MLKFTLLFAALLLGLFVLALTPPGQQYFVQPWTSGVAVASAASMAIFDPAVIAQGATLTRAGGGFAATILPGVEAMIALAAAMLAFPATWKQRLAGIAVGIAVIAALNLVRIVILFYLGQWDAQWFEWARRYLWQALIMLDALFVWMFWVRAVRMPAPSTAPAESAPA